MVLLALYRTLQEGVLRVDSVILSRDGSAVEKTGPSQYDVNTGMLHVKLYDLIVEVWNTVRRCEILWW